MIYKVSQNHNYNFVLEQDGVPIVEFRDLRGSDLEYVETLLEDYADRATTQIILLCELLCVEPSQLNFNRVPYRLITIIYTHLLKYILSNCYMKKSDWYKMTYFIGGKSLSNVLAFEQVPISKMLNMYNTVVELCPSGEKEL